MLKYKLDDGWNPILWKDDNIELHLKKPITMVILYFLKKKYIKSDLVNIDEEDQIWETWHYTDTHVYE